MNMLRYMQPFHTDHIPRILLNGNGLHRACQRLAFKQISINVLYKHNDDIMTVEELKESLLMKPFLK